jgi:hypothetical protein
MGTTRAPADLRTVHLREIHAALGARGFAVAPAAYARFVSREAQQARWLGTRFGCLATPFSMPRSATSKVACSGPVLQTLSWAAAFGWQLGSVLLEIESHGQHREANEVRLLAAQLFAVIAALDYLIDETPSGPTLGAQLSLANIEAVLEGRVPWELGSEGPLGSDASWRAVFGVMCSFVLSAHRMATRNGSHAGWERICDDIREIVRRELGADGHPGDVSAVADPAVQRTEIARLNLGLLGRVVSLAGVGAEPAVACARWMGEVTRIADDLVDLVDDAARERPNVLLLEPPRPPRARLASSARLQIDAGITRLLSVLGTPIANRPEISPTREFARLTVARGVGWPLSHTARADR